MALASTCETVAAGQLCRELGHEVHEIACPFGVEVIDDFLQYWGLVAWLQTRTARLTLHWRFDTSRLEPWTLGLARTFLARPGATLAAVRRLRAFGRTYAGVMQSYDVLVCPTLAEPPPLLGHLSSDVPFPTAFERLRRFIAGLFDDFLRPAPHFGEVLVGVVGDVIEIERGASHRVVLAGRPVLLDDGSHGSDSPQAARRKAKATRPAMRDSSS